MTNFAARVEQALLNTYHGETDDARATYVVRKGRLPEALTGRVFMTVFPYESVMEGPGTPASPHNLTATGRVMTMDFGAGPTAASTVAVATKAIRNESWHLRNLVPEAFIRSDFPEFSWFGVSNLSNTSPVQRSRLALVAASVCCSPTMPAVPWRSAPTRSTT